MARPKSTNSFDKIQVWHLQRTHGDWVICETHRTWKLKYSIMCFLTNNTELHGAANMATIAPASHPSVRSFVFCCICVTYLVCYFCNTRHLSLCVCATACMCRACMFSSGCPCHLISTRPREEGHAICGSVRWHVIRRRLNGPFNTACTTQYQHPTCLFSPVAACILFIPHHRLAPCRPCHC